MCRFCVDSVNHVNFQVIRPKKKVNNGNALLL